MTYKLTFLHSALKEWEKLDKNTQDSFKSKLRKICVNPHTTKNKLSGLKDCYKIKLKNVGYRLVYRVFDDRVVVQVISVGKRDKQQVYRLATERLKQK